MTLSYIPLQEAGAQGGFGGIVMILLLFGVFFVFMVLPQRRKQNKIRKMRDALNKGDQVVTIGGIHGTIAKIYDNEFDIEIAKGVNITVDKTAVYPLGVQQPQ